MNRDLLRADGGGNEGEIDVVETYGGGMDTGIAESTVHFSQTGGKGRGLAVPPELHRLGWFVFQSGVFRWDSGGGVVVSGH